MPNAYHVNTVLMVISCLRYSKLVQVLSQTVKVCVGFYMPNVYHVNTVLMVISCLRYSKLVQVLSQTVKVCVGFLYAKRVSR